MKDDIIKKAFDEERLKKRFGEIMYFKEKIKEVLPFFQINDKFISCEMVDNGNVNKTFYVSTRKGDSEVKYVVQAINTYAFKNPEVLMKNIDLVTEYISKKAPNSISLHFYHTVDDKPYLVLGSNVWRVFNYIPSVTFNSCEDLEVLRLTGTAFGKFQNYLSDFDVSLLSETIPDFHDTEKRLDKLFEDANSNPIGRKKEAVEELSYIWSVKDLACSLVKLNKEGKIPTRVTHNDTKINNVLFDKQTLKPLCVIDLDTVMPGLLLYDYADAVRFACNFEEEDSHRFERVGLDLEKFTAFTKGFLSKVYRALTPYEIEYMALSCFAITIELASRFLDDYLLGDCYFKINYPQHNLVRCKSQLMLAKDILSKKDKMDKIIKDILSELSDN